MPNHSKSMGASAGSQLPDVLKAVIESCPHGLMLRRAEEVLYANPAWKRLTDAEAPITAADNHANDARETSFTVLFEGRPLDISVIHDRTERAKLEAQLREAQRLEALGRWVGSIVHDFRNVLTAVMLYSDLLAQTTPEASPAAKYNSEIKEAARRGTDLVGQLLSFARQRAPEVTVVSLNGLLSGVRDVLHRMTGEDIDLIFDLCSTPCRARVDATQMQQVVFNLAVNSRQAMPEGGRLIIRTREHIEPASGSAPISQKGWLELVVVDDGVGMDSSTLAHAFDPFFTTKPKGKGTGLGLTTVQSIVAQYGGSVSIESKPAQGTTVRVLLPRVDAAQSEASSESAASAPTGAETILLVEDDPSVRESLSALLKQCGYSVLQAGSGLEAIRLAETFDGRIDLLIADMVLPGLSGREIARRIKLGRTDIRVLFISGYEPGQQVEVPDIFPKPFSKEALAQKVRETLDSSGAGLSRARSTSV